MDIKEINSGIDQDTHWYYQSKKLPLFDFFRKLPDDIQNIIFRFYAEHPTAKIIKDSVVKVNGYFYHKQRLYYGPKFTRSTQFNIVEDESNINQYDHMF
jgi:hypothetical protein